MNRSVLACCLFFIAIGSTYGQPGEDDRPPRPMRGAKVDVEEDADYATALMALTAQTPFAAAMQLALPVHRTIAAGPRAQKLKAMTFDRRPGAMLTKWAPKPKPDADKASTQPKKTPEEEKLDAEMEAFHRAVTLGEWARVKHSIRSWHQVEAKIAYTQILRSLATAPIDPEIQRRITAGAQIPRHILERNVFFTDDLLGLASCSPGPLTKDNVKSLAGMLRQALTNGVVIEHIVDRFGSLQKLLRASVSDLDEVEGVGAARARAIKDGLSRLAETSILDRYA